MLKTDVVVVGAGVAGLAASKVLSAHNVKHLVLDARSTVGGRCETVNVLGANFDTGACWLHNAEQNPLASLARIYSAETVELIEDESNRAVFVNNGEITGVSFFHDEQLFRDETMNWVGKDDDCRVSQVLQAIPPLWAPTIGALHVEQMAGAAPGQISLRDWFNNQTIGTNLALPMGLGRFVSQYLRPGLDCLRLGHKVVSVRWRDHGKVLVTCNLGGLLNENIEAFSVIVTASTRAIGNIEFTPKLPFEMREAIAGLPMGAMEKIVLVPKDDADAPGETLYRSYLRLLEPGDPAIFFHAHGARVVGLLGGETARWASGLDDALVGHWALTELSHYIPNANTHYRMALRTNWCSNPLFGGGWSYAKVGCAEMRNFADRTAGETPLFFAGEAWDGNGFAGTVAGAYFSGQRIAYKVLQILPL